MDISEISERTRVSLFAVLAACFVLMTSVIGGVVWVTAQLTATDAKAENVSQRVDRVVVKLHSMEDSDQHYKEQLFNMLKEDHDRLIRVEENVKSLSP